MCRREKKTLRSLRKERTTQESSLMSKEKVNKEEGLGMIARSLPNLLGICSEFDGNSLRKWPGPAIRGTLHCEELWAKPSNWLLIDADDFHRQTPNLGGDRSGIWIREWGTARILTNFQKALETTTAMKRRKTLRKISSKCAASSLSLRDRCISRSLHDSAKVVISRLLTRNCCSLAVVVSVIFASQ